ncbi:MAG: lytic transglycosylase domain-containing protein [Bacteroidota bacterium]
MKRLLSTLPQLVSLFVFSQSIFANNTPNDVKFSTASTKTEMEQRLHQKSGVFDLRFTADVKKEIQDYMVGGRRTTQRIIGRSQIYFPIIEKYLKAYGLPDELKYLTVIESAMDPNAKSSVGAVGLWQLIPSTARRYGLVINQQIDERRDPHKSTQAALKYLTFLHNLLGDWTLAAAAFNCGGGGVQKAMRLGQGRDFWTIKAHFPSQTQHYISRLASAVYVMNYYHLHGLKATDNDYFMKFTKVATIYTELSFAQISEALDIPVSVLKRLNPSYRNAILPDSTGGNYLVLPKLKMDGFINYYNNIVASADEAFLQVEG